MSSDCELNLLNLPSDIIREIFTKFSLKLIDDIRMVVLKVLIQIFLLSTFVSMTRGNVSFDFTISFYKKYNTIYWKMEIQKFWNVSDTEIYFWVYRTCGHIDFFAPVVLDYAHFFQISRLWNSLALEHLSIRSRLPTITKIYWKQKISKRFVLKVRLPERYEKYFLVTKKPYRKDTRVLEDSKQVSSWKK